MSVAGSRIAEDSSRKSVRKYPGPTIVAVMPNSSSSRTSDSVKPATSEELPAWLFAAERYVGIDRRGPAGRQVAGKERGTDQRNRRHHQHPRIDDGDVQLEIRARDRPADEANRQPEDEPVEDRTIAVHEHHALDLSGGGPQRHPHADLPRAVCNDMRLDAVEARHGAKQRDSAEADRSEEHTSE